MVSDKPEPHFSHLAAQEGQRFPHFGQVVISLVIAIGNPPWMYPLQL
jgi:hypothetical protein